LGFTAAFAAILQALRARQQITASLTQRIYHAGRLRPRTDEHGDNSDDD
jgi:hypothetical protein